MKPFILSIILILLMATGSGAASVGGVELPMYRGELRLQGAELLRKGLIIKIYVGALYTPETTHDENILSNVSKRIDIHYFHHTPKSLMIRVANETLKKNLSADRYTELLPKIEQLHNAYRNGKKGSFASIIHTPGEGLAYCFDNEPVLTIEGDDFANAYFTIWLGEEPSSQTVKKGMLNHD